MAELQIAHRKSNLVLSARFPVVKWRSRSVAKSAYLVHARGASGEAVSSDERGRKPEKKK